MQVKNRLFPYPVINHNKILSNFGTSDFQLLYDGEETEKAYLMKNARFYTESKLINQLFDEGKIIISCIVECSYTVYRKRFELTREGKTISLALTVDESLPNKYELTNWVIENPERFRNLTWRSFSSEEHLVRGIIKGEKKVIDANPDLEKNSIYPEIAKYVSIIGSVRLLDIISEEDIAAMICEKTQNLIA